MSTPLDTIFGGAPPSPDTSSSSSSSSSSSTTTSSSPSPPEASPPPPVTSPPPPDTSSSSSSSSSSPSPPPPSPPADNPPPQATPSPPSPPASTSPPATPATSATPATPSTPSTLSTLSTTSQPATPSPVVVTPAAAAATTTEQPKSPETQFTPAARTDSPVSALAPPHADSLPLPESQLAPKLTQSSTSGSSNTSLVLIVGIAVSGALILALIIACFLSKRRKKRSYYYDAERPPNDWNKANSNEHIVKLSSPPQTNIGGNGQWGAPPPGSSSGEYGYHSGQHGQNLQPASPMGGLGFSSQSHFSYDDLAAATSGFSQANLLGQGGFGYVHKGVLPDGRVVAVKSLKSGSGQGEKEFQAEVDIISRVHHRHLVSLVGYCISASQRMLVYEFVSNSTMEHHLHGKGQPVMNWSSRVRIATGSAKGLAYLHEDCHPRIIHRDIKAANILLDENYEAMVADFGLAKLTTDNFTHVSTRVMGTFGYLAPEYAASGKLSEKSDVFSFGVMLLELITGRPPVDLTGQVMEDSLVDWARPLLAQALEDGDYSELADPNMEGDYDPHQMASLISCAAASVRHSGKRRPKMSQIVRALEGESLLAEEGSEIPKRALSKNSGSGSGSTTTSHDSTYDTVAYNADMMKFKKMVLNDDE